MCPCQGAFTGQQHITVQAEDGQSYVAVNQDTIIVQRDSDQLVIAGDGQDGEQQYVIQYITQVPPDAGGGLPGTDVEAGVGPGTEVVTDDQHQMVDQQVSEKRHHHSVALSEHINVALLVVFAGTELHSTVKQWSLATVLKRETLNITKH